MEADGRYRGAGQVTKKEEKGGGMSLCCWGRVLLCQTKWNLLVPRAKEAEIPTKP